MKVRFLPDQQKNFYRNFEFYRKVSIFIYQIRYNIEND